MYCWIRTSVYREPSVSYCAFQPVGGVSQAPWPGLRCQTSWCSPAAGQSLTRLYETSFSTNLRSLGGRWETQTWFSKLQKQMHLIKPFLFYLSFFFPSEPRGGNSPHSIFFAYCLDGKPSLLLFNRYRLKKKKGFSQWHAMTLTLPWGSKVYLKNQLKNLIRLLVSPLYESLPEGSNINHHFPTATHVKYSEHCQPCNKCGSISDL